MKKIGVFGSVNLDYVFGAEVFPKVGETVKGNSFAIHYGGKGANEAVAAARVGASVALFGCVGDCKGSEGYLEYLGNEGVLVDNVKLIENQTCGVAGIFTAGSHNSIVVVGGANSDADEKYLEGALPAIKDCSHICSTLEVPPSAVLKLSRICKQNEINFIFNPSPMIDFDKEILDNASLIIVNEIEIALFGGEDALAKFPNKLILTKGGDGVFFHNGEKVVHIPAIKVDAVDTTGAGDTFLGTLIAALFEDKPLATAIQFANVAAGLKTTKHGAQTGMPRRNEVDEILKKQESV